MNTMSNYYFQQFKLTHATCSKILDIILKVLTVICVYLVFGLLFQHVYASARPDIDPYQSQHGSVWLLPDTGVYVEAMQIQTDVNYEITGAIARARVKQKFKNISSLWAEGIYVFPLPEKAAVDHFRMIIGERIIEGQVKKRVLAKKTYEKARSEGKKTSLIEQQRPNVFTTSLANIAPGEEITVEFEYQQILDYKDKRYQLRFPMVVGPRYHPPHQSADNTSVHTETDSQHKTHNPTRIHILLDAGVNLTELNSSYHKIHINQTSETRYSISTIGENIVADRDFELVWMPALSHYPQLSVFNEKVNNDNYSMITLLSPDPEYMEQKVQARDVVFVLDVSGSMAGTSIEQAKAALITALDGLSSIDRFNIIWFNDETDSLFAKTIIASSQYKNIAKQFIDSLQAGGGTEMLPAMKLALSKQEEFSRFKQVVFLTDGNISNESELFIVINKQLGNSRLFTIGIGSAPNSYFMRKAAQHGRGTFTYIGDINEVHKKTTALFKKLESPALINIQLELNSHTNHDEYEIFPKVIPDLYAGETATILIKSKEHPQSISIKGDYGNSEWKNSSQVKATTTSGIRVAWAREKVASLMSQRHESTDNENRELIQQKITDTALQHHLVSRYTSLVAVDVTPVNANGMLYRERMKNNLPHGWGKSASANEIMLAQTAAGSAFNLLLSFLFFVGALLAYQFFIGGKVISGRSGITP